MDKKAPDLYEALMRAADALNIAEETGKSEDIRAAQNAKGECIIEEIFYGCE